MITSCSIRRVEGNLCGGTASMTSYAIMARPRWSITCPDGKVVRFESNDELEEAIKALKKDH